MLRRGHVLVLSLLVSSFTLAQPEKSVLSLGTAGIAVEPETLAVAAPLANLTDGVIAGVRIERVALANARLRTQLPITIKAIPAGGSEVVQVDFDSKGLVSGKPYVLVISGTYYVGREEKGPVRPFRVQTSVVLAPPSPGSHELGKTQASPHKTEGGRYKPQQPKMDKDVNQSAPPVPKTAFVPSKPTPTGTEAKPAPVGDPPAITFDANNPVGITGAGLGCSGDANAGCAEPSGASGNGVILVSANWRVAYSTNGGGSFTVLDPTTIFPPGAVGFCCDQIIQYAPQIDRFIWLLQGSSGYRLAMASPADIKNSGGTAWIYWELTPGLFGKCTSFDYPDLSIGNNSLYISWDANVGAGCTAGFQVARTSLAGIQAAGTITLDFTDPANAPLAKVWGEHLTQDTDDEIFWAGHNGNSKLTVYSLKEGSNTYFWRDVGISSWANNAPTSTTPDGLDWLAKNFNGPGGNSFPRNGIIGAARSGNSLWFGWTAGTDNNFRQAHIEIVELDRANNFNKVQQVRYGTTATPLLIRRFPATGAPASWACLSSMAVMETGRTTLSASGETSSHISPRTAMTATIASATMFLSAGRPLARRIRAICLLRLVSE